MKQGHVFGKIIYALFAVFVIVYIIGMAWNAMYNPVKTVTAVHIAAEDSIATEGFIVRNERLVSGTYSGVVEMQIAEGERAAKGDVVAYIYSNQGVLDKVHKRKELSERIARLEMLANQGNEVVDLKSVDNSIVKMSEELIEYYQNNDASRMYTSIENLKNKTLSREYVYRDRSDLKTVIDGLKKERTAIGNVSANKAIYAPVPGYYSGQSDGYEAVLSCDKIEELTPAEFKRIDESISMNSQNDGTLGKIISEFYWYYTAILNTEDAEFLREGKSATISFEGAMYPRVKSVVEWISAPQDGKVCVAFRVDEQIGKFTLARKLPAEIVVNTYEGLKVPREALRMNEDGVQGVYCLIDSQVKFKPVKTIFEKDSYYIVEYDSSDTKGLLLYDEIVVSAKELEHKKMVK